MSTLSSRIIASRRGSGRLLASLLVAGGTLAGGTLAAASTVDSDDSAALLRDGRQFRFRYANDLFAARDRYFTQGFGFELFHPAVARSPLTRALLALPEAERFHGARFRHAGFTPTSLFSDAIRRGDRPFASYLFFGQVLVSRDERRGVTLTSGLDAGLIGQGAGGEWIQTGLHGALGNLLPQGWGNQIRNDLVLDYYARLEKTLGAAEFADAGAFADATLGTLYTNASAGLMLRAGRLGGARRLYVFGRIEEKLVGYDATLQGGLINRNSLYTLPAAQVERLVERVDLGATWDRGPFAFVFTRTFLGREFREGLGHRWGEISLLWRF